MIPGTDSNFALGFDELSRLREQASKTPQAAVKGVAQQFEAQFLQMILKSMRDATPQDGLFDSDATRSYVGMLDQQLAHDLAKSGVGLAPIIARQLERAASAAGARDSTTSAAGAGHDAAAEPGGATSPGGGGASTVPAVATDAPPAASLPGAKPTTAHGPAHPPAAKAAPSGGAGKPSARVARFVEQMAPHAEQAAAATGIPARFMIAQAALESGWGRHEPRRANGAQSFNLFGIKAGADWKGPVAIATTTEYVGGVARKVVQSFRAYGSYAEAFADYGRLLSDNPRYAAVAHSGGDTLAFARGLQRAGYATDPEYANKLGKILGRTLTA